VTTQVDANAKIALTILEAWNTKDYERAYGVLADDFEAVEVATGATFAGPTGLRQEYTLWHTAMSDGRIDVTNVISSGSSVAIESMVRGTHDGIFVTDIEELAATGRSIEFPMCTIATIVNGAYALERHYFDMQSLLKQFGAD
jgi:steroid delta-isomerase-like uncharacterized protein